MMDCESQFQENDHVMATINARTFYGHIRGKATTGQPVIGCSWIVQLDADCLDQLNEDYPYSSVALFGCQLTRLP